MSSEPVPSFSAALTPDDEGNVVVTLSGEIDLFSADQVWAALVEALTAWTGQVVVDFSGVSFLDSPGLHALLRVHTDCDFDAGRLTRRSPQPQARKVFEMTSTRFSASRADRDQTTDRETPSPVTGRRTADPAPRPRGRRAQRRPERRSGQSLDADQLSGAQGL